MEVARVGVPDPRDDGGLPDCAGLLGLAGSVSVDEHRHALPAAALTYARAGNFRHITSAPLRWSTGATFRNMRRDRSGSSRNRC